MTDRYSALLRSAADLHLQIRALTRTRDAPQSAAAADETTERLLERVREAVRLQRANGVPWATDPDIVWDELIRASEDLVVQVERARALDEDGPLPSDGHPS